MSTICACIQPHEIREAVHIHFEKKIYLVPVYLGHIHFMLNCVKYFCNIYSVKYNLGIPLYFFIKYFEVCIGIRFCQVIY